MTNDTTGVPQNLEAEEAVLGAMLMSAAAIEAAEQVELHEGMFYRPSHRVIHRAMIDLREQGEHPDELAVINYLRSMPVPKEFSTKQEGSALSYVGGPSALMSLVERVPAVANAKAYAREVRGQWVKRRLMEIGHEVVRQATGPTTDDEAVRTAETLLLEVVTATGKKHQRGDRLDGAASMDRWTAAYERRLDPEQYASDTLSWSTDELTQRLGRAIKGAVYIPAGWTKHGKTWWVLEQAEAFMEQGARTLFLSGEMSDEQLVDRWIAMGGHNYTGIQEGKVPWNLLHERRKQIERWDRRTLTGRLTIERLRSEVSRAKLEGRAYRVVVLDHLGLLRPGPGQGRQGRTEFLEEACAELQAMAEEYGFTLLLVSQLSRPQAERGNHPKFIRAPIASDLKGASGIEQIATAVIFVYRMMDPADGRFIGQDAMLLYPFHRLREPPERMACEFTLPHSGRRKAYRFEPKQAVDEQLSAAAEAVQEQLIDTFGPGVTAMGGTPDEEIPF